MSISKINQKGFSAVGVAIIIVVVIALGAGGYYVWHKSQKSAKTTNTTTLSSQSTTTGNSTSQVVKTTLSNVPLGLQTTISNNLKSGGCILPNGNVALSVGDTTGTSLPNLQVYYMANTAAKINACSALSYYSDNNGTWSFDVGGQVTLTCSTYLKYEIPAALVAAGSGSTTAQCANASGTGFDTYTSN